MHVSDHDLEAVLDRKIGLLIEHMNDQFEQVMESTTHIQQELSEIKTAVAEIPEIKQDIKTIKKALADTNYQIVDHETRIAQLESQTA